jgi:hypothetical protein
MAIIFQHLVKAANRDTVVDGTSLVYTIQGLSDLGETLGYIAERPDLPLAVVYEALAYAAEHPDEMESIRKADDAAALQALSELPEPLRQETRRARQADKVFLRETIDQASDTRPSETRRSTSAE